MTDKTTNSITLNELGKQIVKVDDAIGILTKQRDKLRRSIIDQMTNLAIDSFSGDNANLSVSVQSRVSAIDVIKLSEDFDLSDCWELSITKIKKRPDIPIENYTTYKKIEVLRVKQNEK